VQLAVEEAAAPKEAAAVRAEAVVRTIMRSGQAIQASQNGNKSHVLLKYKIDTLRLFKKEFVSHQIDNRSFPYNVMSLGMPMLPSS